MSSDWIGMVIQGVGAAGAGDAAYRGAKMRKDVYRRTAAVARQNADYAEMRATHEILAGQHQEEQISLKAASVKGSQRAAVAASGIEMGSGSALDQLTTTDVMSMLDRFKVNENAGKSAWAEHIRAQQFRVDATGADWTAEQISPEREAWGAWLGGMSGAGNMFKGSGTGEKSGDSSGEKSGMSAANESTGSTGGKNQSAGSYDSGSSFA